jgi:hypothetical protein
MQIFTEEGDKPTAFITVGCPRSCILVRESRAPRNLKLVSGCEWSDLASVRFTSVLIQ